MYLVSFISAIIIFMLAALLLVIYFVLIDKISQLENDAP